MVVVAIHKDDCMTVPFLLGKKEGEDSTTTTTGLCKMVSKEHESAIIATMTGSTGDDDDVVTDLEFHGGSSDTPTSSKKSSSKASQLSKRRCMHVRVIHLPEDCHGSADALRYLSQGNTQVDNSCLNRGSTSSSKSPTERESTAEAEQNECSNGCYIPRTSHAVVMPGDLSMEGNLLSSSPTITDKLAYDGQDVLSLLVQAHRRWNACGSGTAASASCTMLLTDVGAEDKEGIPLKESSKAKMGLHSREEEDMEYLGLSSEVPPPLSASLASLSYSKSCSATPSRRVVLKRSKLEVEEDEGIGSTPKLAVPKRRLHKGSSGSNRRITGGGGGLADMLSMSATATVDHSPTISLHTDLHDVHLYVLSNWVFQLIHARPSMQSFQNEVLPLLISRQYRGVEAAFGPTAWKKVEGNRERLRKVVRELDGIAEDGRAVVACNQVSTLLGMYASGKMSGGLGSFLPNEDDVGINPADDLDATELDPDSFPTSKHPFVVSAQVLSREASSLTLRACTLPSLLYGCSEVTSQTLQLDPTLSTALVPNGARLSTKFNSIILPKCSMGEKVQTKACTIGKSVVLGDRAKLNNVVVMDGVSIGSNTVLQNSLVGVGAQIGENCNLKDCQVGPGAVVPSGTKTVEKGEAFHV